MPWKPEVKAVGERNFTANGMRFATQAESDAWLRDLRMRWLGADQVRSVECDDPVNYAIVDGVVTHLPDPEPIAA